MNTELEKWVDIVGYEGLYSVSNLGRIARHLNGDTRILRPCTNSTGYSIVNLCQNGFTKSFRVHRLVAKHFIPNPYGLPEINHKDEDKSNNCATNLEWCTKSYNATYGTRIFRICAKISKPILQYSKTGEFISSHPSISHASRALGLSASNIVQCCKGHLPSIGGFIWRYATEVQDAH